MLFDPFEEQFDLPAAAVKLSDGQGGQFEVVGQEHQFLIVSGVEELDAPQVLRVVPGLVVTGERDYLIAAQAGGFVHWS
ncbi:MAG: hypothetical protein NTAFB09_21100 [Nitrosospira sp.]